MLTTSPIFILPRTDPLFPSPDSVACFHMLTLWTTLGKIFRLNHGKTKVLIPSKLHRSEAGACSRSLSFKFEPNPTTFTFAEKKPSDPALGVSAATSVRRRNFSPGTDPLFPSPDSVACFPMLTLWTTLRKIFGLKNFSMCHVHA